MAISAIPLKFSCARVYIEIRAQEELAGVVKMPLMPNMPKIL
jgi:hypothetical protein